MRLRWLRMPQSLANLLAHLVFSTKNREPTIPDAVRSDLHAYFAGTIRDHDGVLLRAGSVSDHAHLLIRMPRTRTPADMVKEIKIGSSKWLKTVSTRFAGFQWQAGYGMFSVSPSQCASVEAYLDFQAEHHRRVTFQDEYRRLLSEHDVEYDERFVWE